jgi:hypothetical protein
VLRQSVSKFKIFFFSLSKGEYKLRNTPVMKKAKDDENAEAIATPFNPYFKYTIKIKPVII